MASGETVLLTNSAIFGSGKVYSVANEADRNALTNIFEGDYAIITSNEFGNKEVDIYTGSTWQIIYEQSEI